ncbi:DNA damage-regulated autophagy modulator protein 1 [Clonorchis sinensis]|uniref:DNA damage-regulated autophagy modulator protein 1 n=2 Tax=Clonorchis sinensis TaxID=79923 RepID=A0A8T1MEG1_CLOSI|nr:DNA damage-regulated autophagy modulator protein 1 [Clonorchis sinensis]GAA52004.1 DNA damage-regulated autophagy modulator protein 1 [Clonorchis sinensis]
MHSFPLHYLPIVFCATVIITFIVSYAMSTALGDVSALFPYISDTGTLAPESCVFGQFLNLCAFLGCLSIYCWYGHQMDRLENLGNPRSHILHAYVSLGFGLAGAIGLSIVGNFQETSLLVVHLIGALMTFGFGTLYIILCSHASRKHLRSPQWLWVLRTILASICLVSLVAMFLFAGLCGGIKKLPPAKWDPNDENYVYHALSTTFEWVMAFAFLCHFLTMTYELRDYKLDPVKVRYRYVLPASEEQPLIT